MSRGRGFDGLAPLYELLEKSVFGSLLDRTRTALLEHDDQAVGTALLLGEGDGRFLLSALQAWPRRQFLVVDGSHAMLGEAKQRIALLAEFDQRRVRFLQATLPADLNDLMEEGPFAVISTHFFLDCFTQSELERWIPKLAAQLEPNSTWLTSDFRQPAFGAARLAGGWLIALMYRFFRVATGLRASTLPDDQATLSRAELQCRKSTRLAGGFLYAESWRR